MTQPNPLTGTRPQTVLAQTLNITPVAGTTMFFYHAGPIKILDFNVVPSTAGTTPAYTVKLQSYVTATGTDIMSTATSSLAAGAKAAVNTLATGATLTRPANEILAVTFSALSGTQTPSLFTMNYVMLDS